MINRLDYFTTTINYTCSPVCLRFSINKVIIGRRSGQGNVIQVTDFHRFCFTEGRIVPVLSYPAVYDVECLGSGLRSQVYIREIEYKTCIKATLFPKMNEPILINE